MRTVISILCLVCIVLLSSCFDNEPESANGSELTIATWNVQNLFNGVNDGNEYDEYKEESGWNDKAYKARLRNIKTVFSYFNADAVVLNEVENEEVVSDIIDTLGTFSYYAVGGETDGAIKTAVISKLPISSVRIHSITGTRPILETEISTSHGTVHLFAVHGKSKRDGNTDDEKLRLEMGKVLMQVAKVYPGDLTVIAGDFNEEVSEANIFCDIRFGNTSAPIKVTPEVTEELWYNPFLDSTQNLEDYGTYYYNNQWSYIDNIVSLCPYSVTPGKAKIVFSGILKDTADKPNKYNRNLLTGVSDHLPVVMSFEY